MRHVKARQGRSFGDEHRAGNPAKGRRRARNGCIATPITAVIARGAATRTPLRIHRLSRDGWASGSLAAASKVTPSGRMALAGRASFPARHHRPERAPLGYQLRPRHRRRWVIADPRQKVFPLEVFVGESAGTRSTVQRRRRPASRPGGPQTGCRSVAASTRSLPRARATSFRMSAKNRRSRACRRRPDPRVIQRHARSSCSRLVRATHRLVTRRVVASILAAVPIRREFAPPARRTIRRCLSGPQAGCSQV